MKARAFLAGATIVAGSFNPILATQAWAATTILDPNPSAQGPSADTLTAMEQQCDALAAAHDTANGDLWTAEVVAGSITLVSGPTESGSHTIADAIDGTLEGAGTFTPGHVEILGDPYRNGGSPNMFGIKQAVGGHYSASTYDFEGEFKTTYSYAFSCNIYQAVYHAAVDTPGHPVEGYYIVAPDANGNEEANTNSCNAFTAQGPTFPHWGKDHAQCQFITTAEAEEPTHEDEYLDDPVLVGNEPGVAIEEEQTDTLRAHEDAGEGFDTSETLIIGQAVVCISPSKNGSKLPGSWVKQNGYTGDKCTTDWYNGGAKVGVPNLNDGSHNWVTVPVV